MNLLGHLLVGVCVFRIGSAAFNIMFARRRVDPITRLIHLTVYWGNAEFVRLPATAHFEAMNSHELAAVAGREVLVAVHFIFTCW